MTSTLQSLSFFFNNTATTEIYTLSLHDALPICCAVPSALEGTFPGKKAWPSNPKVGDCHAFFPGKRSEEHTSELQSLTNLVCRLLLEKKKKTQTINNLSRRQQASSARRQRNTTE